MKSDLKEAAIGKAPQRKKWAKPVMRVASIKDVTKGSRGLNADGASPNPRS